ncbi:MAG: rRNA pseudouridine synthase [Acidobacteriaceae bacterium]|nr:rRNA pseudouridine synthase [Acidobacteriaceae bacterium]
MPEERLQKILAQAGVASRRKAEEMITAGLVTVNGKVITELGSKADLETDHIKVNGKRLHAPDRLLYFVLNKPKACVTTMDDPEGRPTVMDLVRGVKGRIFPVGRLDYQTEGLLLLTNDGEFANRITSPKFHVPKTYVAKIKGHLTPEQEEQFRNGISLSGRRTAPAGLKLIRDAENPWYEVTLVEGRQNQIRLMFKHFGHLVEKLKRVKVGFLALGPVRPGEMRPLTSAELAKFRRVLKLDNKGQEHG